MKVFLQSRRGVFISLVFFPAVVAAQALPDLQPQISDITIRKDQTVQPGDVAEGCADSTSGRTLIAFTHTAWNNGPGDIDLGDPMCPSCEDTYIPVCGNPLFECSPAGGHNHAHLRDFSSYTVSKRGQTDVVVRGHKEGFYLVNSICIDGVTPPSGGNGNFLAAGCGDIYSSGLGCQYVDVTKLKPGKYTLSVELNPLRKIEEASYDNNLQTYDFEICSRKPDSLKFSYGLGREDLGGKRAFTVEAEIRYKSAKSIKFYNPMYQGLQADLTARPRSAMSLTIPAGKVGKGCYPKDGWKLIEKNVWEYRNDSGLDPDCYSGTYSDIRTARVKKANNKLFVTLRGRADVSAFPGVPDSAAFVMTSTGFPTSSGNETCAYQGESGRCKRVGPGKALVLCD